MFGQVKLSTDVNSSNELEPLSEQIMVFLPVELIERARDAAHAVSGLTFAGLIEEAVTEAVDWLERENVGAFRSR